MASHSPGGDSNDYKQLDETMVDCPGNGSTYNHTKKSSTITSVCHSQNNSCIYIVQV